MASPKAKMSNLALIIIPISIVLICCTKKRFYVEASSLIRLYQLDKVAVISKGSAK